MLFFLKFIRTITDTIQTLPEIDYAEPDAIMQALRVPNDPGYGSQWDYFAPVAGTYGINMPGAWDFTIGSASVVVAVIDTGILNYPDLAGRTVPGYDFISNLSVANDANGRDNNPSAPDDRCNAYPSSWHGTHAAGTIALNGNNGVGVAGINWQAKILPVRVLGKCGGNLSDIAAGIRWAAGLIVTGVPANASRARDQSKFGRWWCL